MDDVEGIVELMRRHCESVVIETDSHILTEVADLPSVESQPLHKLHIRGSNPDLWVELGRNPSLFAHNGLAATRGLADLLTERITERRGVFAACFSTSWAPLPLLFAGLYFMAATWTHTTWTRVNRMPMAVAFVVWVIAVSSVVVLGNWIRTRGGSVVPWHRGVRPDR